MKTTIGFAVAALALGGFAVLGNGCSSSSSSAGPDDAATGKTDGKVVHEASTDDGGDVPACYADNGVSIPWGAPVLHQNMCDAGQIQAYYDNCLTAPDPDAGVADAAADAGTPCDNFILANVGCASCILGPLKVPDAGTAPTTIPAPVVYNGSDYVFLNIAGCLGAISGADAACQSSFANAQTCAALDCEGCVADDDNKNTATNACENYDLSSGACATSYPVDSTCATTINGVSDADATAKCGLAASGKFEDAFKGIAKAFCGAP